MFDYIRGRWLTVQPQRAGVYLVRIPGTRPWVAYCDHESLASGELNASKAAREYFHLEGDADGHPTRWDDPRVVQLAEASGWREQRSAWT
jgi:hypothetical protein